MKPHPFCFAILLTALASCGSGESARSDQTSRTKTEIAVAQAASTAAGLSVKLLADGPLETGLNTVYIDVKDSAGRAVEGATVTFTPAMAMSSGKNHGAPVLGPATLEADGLYQTAVVFQMASGDMGRWSAKVSVERPGTAAEDFTFDELNVAESGLARVFSYAAPQDDTTRKYVASLSFKQAPKVGLNPIVATLHHMADMFRFEPIDDATLALDPQMPSMGHGSPGSVDPTRVAAGRYEGQLSFSMPGEWEVTVSVERAGVSIGAPTFKLTF